MLDHINDVTFNENNIKVYREIYSYDGKTAVSSSLDFVKVSIKPNSKLSNGDYVEIVRSVDEDK